MSALPQLHLHSPLNTWLQYVARRQLQADSRSIWVSGFGVTYIRDFTIVQERTNAWWQTGYITISCSLIHLYPYRLVTACAVRLPSSSRIRYHTSHSWFSWRPRRSVWTRTPSFLLGVPKRLWRPGRMIMCFTESELRLSSRSDCGQLTLSSQMSKFVSCFG